MNSKIIICKDINLDKNYFNVLDYTETEMLALCQDKALASANNFNFVRENRREIQVEFPYATCLQCNYLAYQNPDYSNKWFFAFIDSIEFVSPKNTRITFTVDEHATWFDYWDPKACLVLREHVASDNIGEHTYPEGIEHGDYICNASGELGGFSTVNSKIIVATTWLPNNTPNLPSTQYYGGVFSGVYYIAFDPFSVYANNFIRALDGFGRSDAIVAVFMAPNSLCIPATPFSGVLHSKINNDDGTTSPHDFSIEAYFIGINTGGIIILNEQTVSMQTTLNGYQPHNNKCLVYPYNYLLFTNNCGSSAMYRYEEFINNVPVFNINGTLSPGCSIKLYPENYKKIADTTDGKIGFSYGLMASKFPICSWQNDAFVNWMTQQSVNHTTQVFEEVLSLGTGLLSNGEFSSSDMGIGGGNFYSAGKNYINQVYQHALVSPQQRGSLNGADVAYAIDEVNFRYFKMSISAEYARMIDSYFDKYGYKVNRIKVPSMLSRTYWNYIQIGSNDDIGYSNSNGSVPANSMDEINSIYRRGTTIWHDHANVGDYSLSNTIAN